MICKIISCNFKIIVIYNWIKYKVKKSFFNISGSELEALLEEVLKVPKITDEAIIVKSTYLAVIQIQSALIVKPKLDNTEKL